MKKIINGKKYDTETAKYIDERSFSNPRDFRYVYEALYRKKNGEFFLEYKGGSLSRYCVYVSLTGRVGGEGIRPLTIEEAKQWVEDYCDAKTYIELFGEPEE